MKPTVFTAIALLSILAAAATGQANADQRAREFRPLEAKKVAIRPAAQLTTTTGVARDAETLLSKAWEQFDARQWDEASEAFLSVLGKDPKNRLAAEGLAMSVYRSGDYTGAFELARELKPVMPSVQELVSETVLADVQFMVSKGAIETAQEFMANFPSSDSEYGRAHDLLGGAQSIAAALGGADSDITREPGSSDSADLATN
tara:strand:+ start:286 stop:894 length:609 start_codon:yes stop_codon:yes gene_type:complete